MIPEKKLFKAVVANATLEHTKRIRAAMDGSSRANVDGIQMAVEDEASEIALARLYFGSDDFREVCENADLSLSPDAVVDACVRMARAMGSSKKVISYDVISRAVAA